MDDSMDDKEVDYEEQATSWLRDVAVAPAGLETEAIHVPHTVQDSLLRYYADTMEDLGDGDRDADADAGQERGRGTREKELLQIGDLADDNDVPDCPAPQRDTVLGDDDLIQPTRERRLASEALMYQQMQNQVTAALGVGSLASLCKPSLHATVVVPFFHGGALAVIKRFTVFLAWATVMPTGLSFFCTCGLERGAACVETCANKQESSPCVHADALRRACLCISAQTRHKTLDGLIAAYPALVATRTLHPPRR